MRITALAGGVGGARFLRGLLHHLESVSGPDTAPHDLTIVANTGDDITLFGLRVSPDIDTLLYTAYGAQPQWFGLGDLDFATHIVRSQWLGQGATLSEVTSRLASRWGLPDRGVRVMPMTDAPVETHVVVEDEQGQRAIHFQEWWVRHGATLPAQRFVVAGLDRAAPAPGVLEAIRDADVILLPPSNPVVSIGIILGIPGVRDALRGSRAPVVGVSPLIDGQPVRGHADACLAAIGVPSTSVAVAGLYEDFLDAWLIDPADEGIRLPRARVAIHQGPLLMRDVESAADIAGAALALATGLRP
jgi:LPPG:FO 2-phospho-L-lactate transferase